LLIFNRILFSVEKTLIGKKDIIEIIKKINFCFNIFNYINYYQLFVHIVLMGTKWL